MARRVVISLLLVSLLMAAAGVAVPDGLETLGRIGQAAQHLFAALTKVLVAYEQVDYEWRTALHALPPTLIPLVGAAQCALLALAVWGLYALALVRGLLRRVNGSGGESRGGAR